MLTIDGLSKALGDLKLSISLEVASGECLALVGRSGAGKTSLLRCVAGLRHPDSGRIVSGDEVWSDSQTGVFRAPEDRRSGYLFQDYALFPHLNAWQNVAYPLRGARSARREQASALLERFGLGAHVEAKPDVLSGGERQRVALARALALDPQALLLDEPLSALDVSTRRRAARELERAVATAGVPTLLVTHDFEEAATLATEIAVIENGQIVQRGTAAALASAPRSEFVADLVGSVVMRGIAGQPGQAGTPVTLRGGPVVWTTDACEPGEVALSVHPWEVLIEPAGSAAAGSARNRVAARVVSVTELGSRVRLGLDAGQPLAAEVTTEAVRDLRLTPGAQVLAVWKASATRIIDG